jgi:chromosome segregation ATPase
LQDKNPRRGQQIARLERENFDLDNRIQKALGDIKLIQQSMVSGDRLQKEKLKLMKMIYDSQQRQESLHEAILRATASVGHDDRPTGALTMKVHQLELELKSLEKNYLQLKDSMEQMSKNLQAPRMTASGHIEEEKLQSSIDDLNRQGVGLRADLDDLLSQMVDLDKRKARLEAMAQHLP